MKRWQPMFGGPIFKLASSFSLLLALCVVALAIDYQTLDARLRAEPDSVRALQILKSVESDLPDGIRGQIDALPSKPGALDVDDLRLTIARAGMEQGFQDTGNVDKSAHDIKNNPLYQDDGDKSTSNWLGKAFSRLKDLFKFKGNSDAKRPDLPNLNAGGIGFLTPVVWGLLAAAIAVFAYFALRHVNFKKTLKRGRKAVLEEDEPERSLDEWLGQADALAAQGKFREAVRALYLACLLKFDEKRVARFIRAETNWEHLARIQASPTLPHGLDFRPPTQAFDIIWYGHRVNGITDVDRFRTWYSEVKSALEAKA